MRLKKVGRYYHAQYKTAEGNTVTTTTRCTDKAQARKVARESGLEQLEMAAKSGRLTKEAVGFITAGRKVTVQSALSEFVDWMTSIGRSDATIRNHSASVERWMKDKKLEHTPPATITEKQVSEWVNDPELDTKANTRSSLLSGIRTFFLFCSAKGWVVGDPSRAIVVNYDILTHSQKETRRSEPFTQWEITNLLKYTEENGMLFWHFAVKISRETGLRLSDVCNLEWECFSTQGHMTVWTRKRDRRVAVPISYELEKLASDIPVRHPQFMFPEQREMMSDRKKRAALSVQFGRLLAKCDIKGKSFHGLRHTLVTELRKQGKTLKDVALIVGHSNEETTKIYDHSQPKRKLVLQ